MGRGSWHALASSYWLSTDKLLSLQRLCSLFVNQPLIKMKLCKVSIECYVNNKDIKYESHYFLLILIHFTVIYAFDVIYISSICKVGMLYNII